MYHNSENKARIMQKIKYFWLLAIVLLTACSKVGSNMPKETTDSTKVEPQVLTAESIYKNTHGEIIDHYESRTTEEIAPHLAKRHTTRGFDGWQDYSCNGSTYSYRDRHPKFTVEFRLISYEIEE